MCASRIWALNNIIKSGLYDDFLNYAFFIRLHKRYSVFNASLIYAQRPGAGFVTTETDWERRHGRLIKPGAVPLVIMQPFGPVNFVYEKSDTYPIDEPDGGQLSLFDCCDFSDDEQTLKMASKEGVSHLVGVLMFNGVYCTSVKLGERLYGQCVFVENPITYTAVLGKDKEKRIVSHYFMPINCSNSHHEQFLTLLHEMGHLLCGHVGYDKNNKELKFDDRSQCGLSTEQKEFEAETVCKLVSERLGIQNNSDEYLRQYLVDGKMPPMNLQVVIEATDKLLKIIYQS